MNEVDTVRAYYDDHAAIEWERLEASWLEYAITRHFIASVASPGSEILDLGGGPGRYALDLAVQGHQVDLADLSPANIARSKGIGLRSARVMDARDLSAIEDGVYDLVLCLGPLYHLPEEADRIRTVQECLRVLRPGGYGFFAFISRYAPVHFLLKTAPNDIAKWQTTIGRALEHGRYGPGETSFFTDAVMLDPDAIEPFMAQFDVQKHLMFGAESMMAQSEGNLRSLSADVRQRWQELAIATAATRAALFASEHVVFVGRKPA